MRFYDTVYISFVFRNMGMMLHKVVQLEDMYGILRTNIEPNIECIKHWRKAGYESDADIGIFPTRLYGVTFRGYLWYIVRSQ